MGQVQGVEPPRFIGFIRDITARKESEEQLRRSEAELRLATLTPRERDILDAIAAGLGNKAIARRLDLSPRTVEVHRANIMRRAGATSVAELLRLRFTVELADDNPVHFGAGRPAPTAGDRATML